MIRTENLGGSLVVDVGHKGPGEALEISPGRYGLWLIDGQVQWKPKGVPEEDLMPQDETYDLYGPGTLNFSQASHFMLVESSDELGFNARAPLYRTLMEARNREVGRALAEGLKVDPRQIWIDIGTGTGAMVQALQELDSGPGWIIGVDRALRMIDEAWRRGSSPSPAWFVAHDLLTIRWPHQVFDGATALLVLHLVDDIDQLLGRLYQSLKPGGVFAYAASSDANPFVQMIMHQVDHPGNFFKRGQGKIRKSVTEAGFEIIRQETYQDRITLDNPQAMVELISSIGGPASRGIRRDIVPPTSIDRVFDLVWAQKPAGD